MNRSQPFVVVVLLIGLFLIGSSVYTVSEVNQAIITQFGEPVGEPVIEPGLHFNGWDNVTIQLSDLGNTGVANTVPLVAVATVPMMVQ